MDQIQLQSRENARKASREILREQNETTTGGRVSFDRSVEAGRAVFQRKYTRFIYIAHPKYQN